MLRVLLILKGCLQGKQLLHLAHSHACLANNLIVGKTTLLKPSNKERHWLANLNKMPIWIKEADGELSPVLLMNLMKKRCPSILEHAKQTLDILRLKVEFKATGRLCKVAIKPEPFSYWMIGTYLPKRNALLQYDVCSIILFNQQPKKVHVELFRPVDILHKKSRTTLT